MYKKILDLLKNSNKEIYICGHINPDQDSIGSCLALAKFLYNFNKKVYVLLQDSDKSVVKWQNDFFALKDKIDCAEEYVFIALDVNEKKRLGVYIDDYKNASLKINIDHHEGNFMDADCTISQQSASSTCEIIYKLICSCEKKFLTKSICESLYAGILTDTNGFTRRLSNKTMAIAQELINFKIDYEYIIKSTFSKRTLGEYDALAYLVKNIKTANGFSYAVADLNTKDFVNLELNELLKIVAEDLRKLDFIENFVLFIIKKDSLLTAKVMTKDLPANKIAELFGGGGHKREAGFTINNADVKDIVSKIEKFINE